MTSTTGFNSIPQRQFWGIELMASTGLKGHIMLISKGKRSVSRVKGIKGDPALGGGNGMSTVNTNADV